jgi:transposase-like protein
MFKGRQFDQSVILLCVRWYLAYNLILRDLEEMMAERGVAVDHTTVHRWTVRFSPLLLECFNRRRRAVTGKWHVDETYIKVRGQWMYLYRAIDSVGDTVEFYFSAQRDLPPAKRFFRKALESHGRPERVVIDGSQTNLEAIVSCDATSKTTTASRATFVTRRPKIRRNQYLTDVFDKGRSARMSWKCALRAFCPGGRSRQQRAQQGQGWPAGHRAVCAAWP